MNKNNLNQIFAFASSSFLRNDRRDSDITVWLLVLGCPSIEPLMLETVISGPINVRFTFIKSSSS